MLRLVLAVALLSNFIACLAAQSIPQELRGTWRVRRILPADTISCWGEREAKKLIGTEIECTADSFRWEDNLISHPIFKVTVTKAQEFQEEYSGSGSFVDFGVLGIRVPQVTMVQIEHPPADITGDTIEIPGDEVLIKDPNTIIFSVCNVYFEGKRENVRKDVSR